MHTTDRLSAGDLIDLVIDGGSFVEWDQPVVEVTAAPDYRDALAAARERTGLVESVVCGEGTLRGRRVALVAGEFAFLAGSIGVAAAELLTTAIERATRERLPLLASPVSGGTRMQEGAVAFLQMIKITEAVTAHRAAGLPYLVYLRSPTTGGVLASWGSLGHFTAAQPGALIGFLGPRVYEALYSESFPEDVQTAENLYRHGLLDAVLSAKDLPEVVDRVLTVLLAPRSRPARTGPGGTDGAADPGGTDGAADPSGTDGAANRSGEASADGDYDAWDSILRSRNPRRPGVRKLLRLAATEVTPLNGTGSGEVDPGIILALARFGGAPCVLLGQDRDSQSAAGPLGPAALREARRGMRIAAELRLPLVTVIDTPGAALSREAEEGGLAWEIARCLAELTTHPSPTVSVLLGQGSGGGALALVPADRVIAARHGWLSPLPPEGASAIVHRDTSHAARMADEQGVSSGALRGTGIVDRIVAELPDAAREPATFCRRMGDVIADELWDLLAQPVAERTERRSRRYRQLGLPAH